MTIKITNKTESKKTLQEGTDLGWRSVRWEEGEGEGEGVGGGGSAVVGASAGAEGRRGNGRRRQRGLGKPSSWPTYAPTHPPWGELSTRKNTPVVISGGNLTKH